MLTKEDVINWWISLPLSPRIAMASSSVFYVIKNKSKFFIKSLECNNSFLMTFIEYMDLWYSPTHPLQKFRFCYLISQNGRGSSMKWTSLVAEEMIYIDNNIIICKNPLLNPLNWSRISNRTRLHTRNLSCTWDGISQVGSKQQPVNNNNNITNRMYEYLYSWSDVIYYYILPHSNKNNKFRSP